MAGCRLPHLRRLPAAPRSRRLSTYCGARNLFYDRWAGATLGQSVEAQPVTRREFDTAGVLSAGGPLFSSRQRSRLTRMMRTTVLKPADCVLHITDCCCWSLHGAPGSPAIPPPQPSAVPLPQTAHTLPSLWPQKGASLLEAAIQTARELQNWRQHTGSNLAELTHHGIRV